MVRVVAAGARDHALAWNRAPDDPQELDLLGVAQARRLAGRPRYHDTVLAGDAVRCRIEPGVRVVLNDDSGRGGKESPRLIRAELLRRLEEHRLSMAYGHRHADAGRGDAQLWLVKDLARLVDDLHFLFVVAVGFGVPAARHHVVRELVRVHNHRRLLAFGDRPCLFLELIDERAPGAGAGLIRGHEDP